jgi:DNA-binding MarR family transcriptional regulator
MECLCKIKEVFKKINQFEQKINTEMGVTINEAMVLCCLTDKIMCSGEISTETGISTTRTSRVLLSLEQKGYVTRSFDDKDKRKMMFELATSGIEKQKEINGMEVDLDFKI